MRKGEAGEAAALMLRPVNMGISVEVSVNPPGYNTSVECFNVTFEIEHIEELKTFTPHQNRNTRTTA